MGSTQISISDHSFLHFFAKPSSLCQRGPSYWNLNEEFPNNNASLIRKDLKKFIETESPIIYENFKLNFCDLLNFIQDNKILTKTHKILTVDHKELNKIKCHEKFSRGCIHSGKGPDPLLVEKIIWFGNIFKKSQRKFFFRFLEKFGKLSAILFRVITNFVVNGLPRTQLPQSSELKRIGTCIIRMRIFFIISNVISNCNFKKKIYTGSEQLLMTCLTNNKLGKNVTYP